MDQISTFGLFYVQLTATNRKALAPSYRSSAMQARMRQLLDQIHQSGINAIQRQSGMNASRIERLIKYRYLDQTVNSSPRPKKKPGLLPGFQCRN